MLLECNETEQVRQKVREAMDDVVEREGTQEDKALWHRMGPGQKHTFSLGTFSMMEPAVQKKAKSAAAREWAVGMHEAAERLERENAGFADAVAREVLLMGVGRAEAHDWAGAYEDIHNYLGGLLPWPLREEQPGEQPGIGQPAPQPGQPPL